MTVDRFSKVNHRNSNKKKNEKMLVKGECQRRIIIEKHGFETTGSFLYSALKLRLIKSLKVLDVK